MTWAWLNRNRWILIASLFLAQTTFCAVLAWQGSQFAVVTLAVTSAFLAIMLGMYGTMTGRTLNSWSYAAQKWGIEKDKIMNDVLSELAEYDEEAVLVHGGRNLDADFEYLKLFRDADAAYIAQGIREELHD